MSSMAEVLENGLKNVVRDVSKNIVDVLKSADGLMTIQEVAASASINRLTAAKYLAILEAKGVVGCRTIGRAKLYSIPKEQGYDKK